MSLNKQDFTRLVKEISSSKKSIERAQTTIETKRSELNSKMNDVERKLEISTDTLIEIGRIAVRRFGYTISPEKFAEELDFIFSDNIIAEYVAGEMESLPYAEQLAELYRALNGKVDKAAKSESDGDEAVDEKTDKAENNSSNDTEPK